MRLAFRVEGYFLHGLWDLACGHFNLPTLLPCTMTCMAIDFTIGLCLAVLNYNMGATPKTGKQKVR